MRSGSTYRYERERKAYMRGKLRNAKARLKVRGVPSVRLLMISEAIKDLGFAVSCLREEDT